MDPQSGKPYYYNTATQETSWRPPLIKPGTAKPARAASAAAKGPRDAQRDSASARRTQPGTKPPFKPPAASNTDSIRETKRVSLLTPRSGAATAIQAQSRGQQARASSPARERSSSQMPGHGARTISLEPTGPRDEDALARGMHAASDFISCLQANLRLPTQPLAAFKFEFDGDKALARLAGQARVEALGSLGLEPLSGEQLLAARLAQAEASVPEGLGPLDRKMWGAFCVADLDGSRSISRKELTYAFR